MNNSIAISDARSNLKDLVNKISKSLDKVYITVNGKPKVAMISLDELEALEETSEILTIPEAKESIKKGLSQAQKHEGILLSSLK